MKKKCNKYESLFIFGNEEELNKHLKICEECRFEHEKMQKIKALVKEAKPLVLKQRTDKMVLIKLAAVFLFVYVSFFAVCQTFDNSKVKISYNVEKETLKQESCVTKMGLPTDEYGLLIIE